MTKKTADTGAPAGLETIEVLARRHGVSPAVLAGMTVAYGWAEGLAMTEAEFSRAAERWLNAPIGASPAGQK